uniref:Putative inorganic phosphate cotransporter n=1 Tax=Lygus hesperus TaxID=30085 RepID=A0A0A9Y1L0_LYGHE
MFYLVLACCPQRHFTALVCCLGLTISYLMRFSLSIAITEMAAQPEVKEDPNACPYPNRTSVEHHNRTLFPWTEMQQGIILSSFFWGYVFTPVLGGLISEAYGAKPVLGWGVACTSLATFLTPMFVHIWDWIGLIIMRILIGLSQGVVYAALHTLVAHWIPSQERGTWGTVIFTGAQVGNTISMLCTSQLLAAFKDWEIVFYLYGVLGFLWTGLFAMTAFSSPIDHPLLADSEKEVLCIYMAKVRKRKSNKGTPWKKILTSKPVIVMIIAMIGHDWGMFSLVSDIPKYMKAVLHFNIKQNGMFLAMGYMLICVVGISSGVLVDAIERHKLVTLTQNRKIMASLASIGPSFGLIGVTYSGCSTSRSMTCLLVGMAFMGFYYPSLKINTVDLSPNFAGTVGALTHSMGGLSGIIVPYVIGLLTPNGFLMEWRLVFWICFVVIMVTNAVYVAFASADLQPWNDDTEEDPLLREAEGSDSLHSLKL